MSDFENEVRVAVSEALAAMGAADVAFPVEASNMENVDLAVPCFSMAKALRKAPQAIADELAGTIQPSGLIATVSSVNGFLNFCIDSAAMVSGVLSEVISKGAYYGTMAPTGVRVNVEHTSTNPTGPIHVGRARNPVIGDTLARCLKRCGHDVTTEYYVNDVGKQVVILTWGVNNCPDGPVRNGDDSHFDDGLKAAYAAACEKFPDNGEDRDKVDHKTVLFYRRANAMMESSTVVQEQIADMLRRFEDGDQQVIDTVRKTAEMMLGGLRETLGSINVALDRYTWESGYIADGSARATVEEIKKSEYAGQTDDGAWFVDLKDFGIKGKNTKFTFTRSDGTTLYTTRDIAYHIDKFTRSDRVIDVLGEDQKLGSQQLCSVLDILGTGKQPEPMFYAFVSLPEGKMSTRKGVVVYLDDLIDEAVARAYEEISKRRSDMSEDRMREIARIVGVAAVRYNIIRVQPEKQFVFKWEEALNFDGNSGPYLQYVHARACSLLRKAGTFEHDTDSSKLTDEFEVKLVKTIARYEEVLRAAGDDKRVHVLPAYGHDLAVAFNQFYAAVSVLDAGDRKNARLTLVEATKTVLADVLDCLGMGAPEEM